MKSFETWYDEYMGEQPDMGWSDPTQKKCYEAGQQSRQAELDQTYTDIETLQKVCSVNLSLMIDSLKKMMSYGKGLMI